MTTKSTLALIVLCLAQGLTVNALAQRPEPDTFTTIDVPGATLTRAREINARGQIVGFYPADGQTHGFLLDNVTFTTIDVPGASETRAFGINARGQIVGFYLAGGQFHGYLLDNGTFGTIDVPGASETLAFGINARGQIVGDYTTQLQTHGLVGADCCR